MADKARSKATQVRRQRNSNGSEGVKNMSEAIGEAQAKALIAIKGDQDTKDGGKRGKVTTNPQQVYAIVTMAWKVIYDGMAGSIPHRVHDFVNEAACKRYFYKGPVYQVEELTGPKVRKAFAKIKESAGALDG